MASLQIFTNQTVDGNSEEFTVNGKGTVKVTGNFGAGTINLQAKTNNTNDVFSNTGDAYVADFAKDLLITAGVTYRLNLSGSTGASINAFVVDNRAS